MLKLFFVFIVIISITGCQSYNNKENIPASFVGAIVDSEEWYADMADDVLTINVTIPVPNAFNCTPFDDNTAPSRPCTLADIIGDTDPYDSYEPILHVAMKTSDFNAISNSVNAEFEQKGKSTRNAAQKSFRIKLDSQTQLYKKERTLQLNKHAFDSSRVRNMLSYDFFREIPNIPSLKTKFVNLTINDESYGLFTHVEKVGKEYLLNRGWNEDDNLYKAQNFAFRYQSELALDSSGKPVNLDAFNGVIEIERGKEQTKLIEMLNAIDQAQTDAEFEVVFSRYFNRANYITWMALNLIVANKDTVSQNFYLLNPLYSDTFYFCPWDYDGAARDTIKYAKWELGIGTWWGIPLHNKFLKVKKNREELDAMVTHLTANYVTKPKITERLDIYRPLIEPYITSSPDKDELDFNKWETEFLSLPGRLDTNVANYRGEFGVPMPFWQAFSYDKASSVLKLQWDEAIDFEGDVIVYDVECADNYDFNNSIISRFSMEVGTDINRTSWGELSYSQVVPSLNSGDKLFMKITAKEKDNPASYQIAFDKEVEDVNGNPRFGLLEFVIE